MQKIRTNEAYWSESDQRWHIYVQMNGVRRGFVSDKALSQKTNRKGKLQAERKADKWLETQLDDENQKVEVLFDKWIESLKERTQTAYWTQYVSYGKNWIKPAIGRKRMTNLNENDFDSILAAAYKKGLSQKTLYNIRSCLVAFMKYARKCRATTLVPDDIIVPRNAKRGEKRCLTPAEIAKVFSTSQTTYRDKPCEDFYINAYRFLLYEGLRPGEMYGLTLRDFADGGYTINRAINSRGEITTGKNKNARRRHMLSELGKKIVEDQKAMLRKHGLVTQYLFPDFDGRAMRQFNIYAAWQRYCKANGIQEITLYELRHTNYSLNKDMPEAYKKLLFGHSASFNGDAVYDHATEGSLSEAARMNAAAFEKVINGIK